MEQLKNYESEKILKYYGLLLHFLIFCRKLNYLTEFLNFLIALEVLKLKHT